jgi:Protein of unknown function (DUF3341)
MVDEARITGIYGLRAEFDNPTDVVRAAQSVYDEGYRKLDAYSPYPIEELSEAIGFHKNRVPLVVLIGGLLGASGGAALCYWVSAIAYAENVGGRPLNSWPAFIPVAYECTILLAAIFAVLGMIVMNGLPQPYHPVFNAPRFELASRDHFFLCVEAVDPKFDLDQTRAFLSTLGARDVVEVPY